MSASPPPLEVFVSYAPEDEALRIELEKHLALLQHQGHITSFHAGKVSAGSDWKAALDAHLDRARGAAPRQRGFHRLSLLPCPCGSG